MSGVQKRNIPIHNLQKNGYKLIEGIKEDGGVFSVVVHQYGTEIDRGFLQGFRYPIHETRPITILGSAGRIGLRFVAGRDYSHFQAPELAQRYYGLCGFRPNDKVDDSKPKPVVQSSQTGTRVLYGVSGGGLTVNYMEDHVGFDAGVNVGGYDIEPALIAAVEVGGISLIGYEEPGFSKQLLSVGRYLSRLASGTA